MSGRPGDPEHFDQEMAELERELEQELAELTGSDREDVQRRPHLAYAIQWFLFAIILALGYSRFVQTHSS